MFRALRFNTLTLVSLAALATLVSLPADAQTRKKKRTKRATANVVTTLPTPPAGDASVVSRADEYQENSVIVDPSAQPAGAASTVSPTDDANARRIKDIQSRVKRLESAKPSDEAERQRALAANLDILTKAEQRAESMRRQRFELIEKQNAIQSRLDQIEIDIRPEMIERQAAMAGSLRPEELREARRRSLESERRNLQTLLTDITAARAKLELNLQRAEALVDKLRDKLDVEIDAAIEPAKKPDEQ
ncbi:MAG: hypothetical protein ACK4S4_06150 [Pyrinomonadaceae bacterium]